VLGKPTKLLMLGKIHNSAANLKQCGLARP